LVIRYGEFDPRIENTTQLVTERFGMYATKEYLQNFPHLEKGTMIETIWKNPALRPITWKQYFQSKGLDKAPFKVRSYEQEHHVIQAALAGQGIALVSSLLIQTPLQQGWLTQHPSGEFIEGLTYYMISKTSHENSRKIKVFREWLQSELIKEP
jgi:DNA-binding transcriptional LysR family regulator